MDIRRPNTHGHAARNGVDLMSRHPITCILPPDLLLRLAREASPEQREAILDTLQLDHGFRLARAELAARQAPRVPVR